MGQQEAFAYYGAYHVYLPQVAYSHLHRIHYGGPLSLLHQAHSLIDDRCLNWIGSIT